MDNKETFQFTYSAKQQEEIKAIRKKYSEPCKTEDKMEQLRRLDQSVTQKASIVSLASGIIGALILGFGMSLVMSDLGEMLSINRNTAMIIGVIVGIAGIIPVCLAYPLYNRITKKERERIAPEIIRLTDALLK